MATIDRFCEIPIYRLLLKPESYLPENNIGVPILELLNHLPNHNFVNHSNIILHRDNDYKKIYYSSTLVLETKVFCQNILNFANINTDDYDLIIQKNDLNILFEILNKNQLLFFKTLVKNDIRKYKLAVGRFYVDFESAEKLDTAFSILRRYQLVNRIIKCVLGDLPNF